MSRWCPIALTRGVRQAAATRTRDSLLNGSRSSNDPPPRATTITSTRGSRSSSAIAALTSGTARGPCTVTRRISNCTADQRARALDTTSCSASPCCAHDQPDHRRQERQRALARRLEQPLGAEDALEVLDPREQLAEPDQPHVVGGERQRPLLGVELRPRVHDEVRAVGQLVRQLVDGGRRGRDRQRHVEVGVAQRQEVEGVPPLQVQHLPLDPDRRHLRDVVGDLGRQVPHRPRAARGWCPPRAADEGRPSPGCSGGRCSRAQPASWRRHPRLRPRPPGSAVTCGDACGSGAGHTRGAPPSRADAARRSRLGP